MLILLTHIYCKQLLLYTLFISLTCTTYTFLSLTNTTDTVYLSHKHGKHCLSHSQTRQTLFISVNTIYISHVTVSDLVMLSSSANWRLKLDNTKTIEQDPNKLGRGIASDNKWSTMIYPWNIDLPERRVLFRVTFVETLFLLTTELTCNSLRYINASTMW